MTSLQLAGIVLAVLSGLLVAAGAGRPAGLTGCRKLLKRKLGVLDHLPNSSRLKRTTECRP